MQTIETTCCVIGGGPAGIMLGYLLARAGVPVVVLEKHKDFFRDFRGDTVHPSTLQVMSELGLLEDFLKLPHQKVTSVEGRFGDFSFTAASLRFVPGRAKFVALMPQWDFLNFLSSRAKNFPTFELRLQNEATGLLWDRERVTGVEVQTPGGPLHIRANLVVGCDGRRAVTREAAHFETLDFGVPIDVLWFRISRLQDDPETVLGTINYGKALILINRDTYFQAGLIVRKGSFDEIKHSGLAEFRATISQIAPYLRNRVDELQDWNQVQLLSVQINRIRQWHRPGLLCIGDAAHAMSPAGGVGINLAIQDAVAAANLLAEPLRRDGFVSQAALARVQQRREFPTRVTQAAQVQAHKGFEYIFEHQGPMQAPWQMKAVTNIPGLRYAAGIAIGIGVRPEHVHSPNAADPRLAKAHRNAPFLVRAAAALGAAAGISVLMVRCFRR